MPATPDGDEPYDALDSDAQAARRAAWEEEITDRIHALDLAETFLAKGQSWAEADRDGATVIRNSCRGSK